MCVWDLSGSFIVYSLPGVCGMWKGLLPGCQWPAIVVSGMERGCDGWWPAKKRTKRQAQDLAREMNWLLSG